MRNTASVSELYDTQVLQAGWRARSGRAQLDSRNSLACGEAVLPSLRHVISMGYDAIFVAVLASLALLGAAREARAQIPVTDVAAISQSATNEAQTIARLVQQYQQMLQQFQVAQQSLRSITGLRTAGQALLQNGAVRQSLPANYAAMMTTLLSQGVGGGGPAAQGIYNQVRTSPCSGWQGSPNSVAACQAPVMLAAEHSGTVSQALQAAQTRASQLQGLASAADTSGDTKGAADLQARIASEETQLMAEKTMLDYAVWVQQAELQLAIAHQADLGVHIATQSGRSCYSCP
jgi:type IV secretion system protein VirB5